MTISLLLAAVLANPLEVADAACTGTVIVVSRPYTFQGNRFVWNANPTASYGAFNPEWTWQLNRMDFWPAMANAYAQTGDEKYARAFAQQLTDWLDQTNGGIPPEQDVNVRGSLFRTIEQGLRLIGTWRTAWLAFHKSPAFTPELQARFRASARAQANYLIKHHNFGNWLLMEMNGAYSFATLFPEYPECESIRKFAAQKLSDAIRRQILPDGLQNELSPDYHSVAISCAAKTFGLAKEGGFLGELSKDYSEVLQRMADGTIATMAPSFVQPRFNDCYTMHTDKMVGKIAPFFPERADYLWAATRGEKGAPPAGLTASRFLPWSGFVAMRTDWSCDATYLCFDVGNLGASSFHAHQDKLSFTLWKGGEELVFEDGGGQYEDSAERVYARSGYDHNTMLVDGLAQNRKEPLLVEQPIDAGWQTSPDRDRAVGTYDQGYGPDMLPLATQRREIVFDKRQDIVTITDTVASSDGRDHAYDLLFQLDTTDVKVAADGKSLVAAYGPGRRWRLRMDFEGADSVTPVSGRREPSLAGWFIGRNDMSNHVATTVFVRKTARDNVFVTRLHPIP